jgi:Tfp pilus assembly protein PilX
MRLLSPEKNILRSERGIALITAVLACALLLALAILIITISTKDLRVSSQTVVGKHASTAAENALSDAIRNFDPGSTASFNSSGTTDAGGTWNYTVQSPPIGSGMTSYRPVGNSNYTIDVYEVVVTGTTGDATTNITAGIGVMIPD